MTEDSTRRRPTALRSPVTWFIAVVALAVPLVMILSPQPTTVVLEGTDRGYDDRRDARVVVNLSDAETDRLGYGEAFVECRSRTGSPVATFSADGPDPTTPITSRQARRLLDGASCTVTIDGTVRRHGVYTGSFAQPNDRTCRSNGWPCADD